MTFLGNENQDADFIRRTNIAMPLPKDLYPLAKDVKSIQGLQRQTCKSSHTRKQGTSLDSKYKEA